MIVVRMVGCLVQVIWLCEDDIKYDFYCFQVIVWLKVCVENGRVMVIVLCSVGQLILVGELECLFGVLLFDIDCYMVEGLFD